MKHFEMDVPLGTEDGVENGLDYLHGELDERHQAMRFESLRALFDQNESDVAWHDFLTAERLVLEKQYLFDHPPSYFEKGGVIYKIAMLRADADWALFKHFKKGKLTMQNEFLRNVYREPEKTATAQPEPAPAENPPATEPADVQPTPVQPEPADKDDWSAFY